MSMRSMGLIENVSGIDGVTSTSVRMSTAKVWTPERRDIAVHSRRLLP
jgi:hypothetical protein